MSINISVKKTHLWVRPALSSIAFGYNAIRDAAIVQVKEGTRCPVPYVEPRNIKYKN